MFFNSVSYAKQICTELGNLKINAHVITGDTKMNYRAEIIGNFANDEFSVICNVGCIAEGVNIPCIDTVVFMEKRESNIGVIQNIGRGLRKHQGKDFCMVVIVEEMLNYKFIENLIVYDERLTNPRQMLISMGLPKKTKKLHDNFEYSIDGIVKMVEVYTSKGLNKVAAFIKRLHNLDIYSMSEYHKKIKEYTENYPEHPLVDLPGFQWADLVKCDNPYDLDECTNKVLELYETEKDNLKKIRTSIDKLIYLHKLDPKIDIKLLENLKDNPKLSKKLNLLFNSVVGRRVIK
jgi:superfamily II DNA/RNA helicase